MSCACISGARQVRLEFDAMEQALREDLSSLPYWSRCDDNVWSVEVGGRSGYRTPEDIANFLTAFLSDEFLDSIACSWDSDVDQGCCQKSCGPRQDANSGKTSLSQFASKTSSPLLEILKGNQIYSHFQPVFERDAKTIWGYECLMRANHLDGTAISPAQLLEWARAENLLSMLDRVCRETHLRNASHSIAEGKKILINFMPTAIYEPAFCLRSTLRVVEKLGLSPANIVFEVVESEEVRDQDHLKKILEFYRSAGFLTALDDLGAGSSGLGLLASLTPDLVKLDRGLVSKAVNSKSYTAVVRGLVQIAHECDQWILAEGIETEQELNLMRELGVDLFQGFYLARPGTLAPLWHANSQC